MRNLRNGNESKLEDNLRATVCTHRYALQEEVTQARLRVAITNPEHSWQNGILQGHDDVREYAAPRSPATAEGLEAMERRRGTPRRRWNSSHGLALLSLPGHSGVRDYLLVPFLLPLSSHQNINSRVTHPDCAFRNDTVSLQSLIARIVSLQESAPISVLTLKPLWFLFAVSIKFIVVPFAVH